MWESPELPMAVTPGMESQLTEILPRLSTALNGRDPVLAGPSPGIIISAA